MVLRNADTVPCKISVFNHKGGVGKTTISMNIAAMLARMKKRVLLIDSDPQCNLTSYLVASDVVDDLLDHSEDPGGRTIWSALRPVSEATGKYRLIDPYDLVVSNLLLVPGDIRLAEFETDLNEFWAQCLQRRSKGFRGTTAISELVNAIATKLSIDYVFYDSGPNIGPLNRTILLDSHYFIVPVACDLFSLRALKTLGRTLEDWIRSWDTIADLAPRGTYLLPGRPRFLGYVPGGFRTYGGVVSQNQSSFLGKIDKEVRAQIVGVLGAIDPSMIAAPHRTLRLGMVKFLGALAPASQQSGLPVFEVDEGAEYQREEARLAFADLAKRIIELTGKGST